MFSSSKIFLFFSLSLSKYVCSMANKLRPNDLGNILKFHNTSKAGIISEWHASLEFSLLYSLHATDKWIPIFWPRGNPILARGSVGVKATVLFTLTAMLRLFKGPKFLPCIFRSTTVGVRTPARIKYKLSTLCHSLFSDAGPVYLSDLLHVYSPSWQFCSSSDTRTLCIPHIKTKNIWTSLIFLCRSHCLEFSAMWN